MPRRGPCLLVVSEWGWLLRSIQSLYPVHRSACFLVSFVLAPPRYLSQQIVPPVSRLCEPIEGTSLAVLAEKMGLDSSKFTSHVSDQLFIRIEMGLSLIHI